MGKRKFTDQELLDKLDAGMTQADAAKALGVNESSVSKRLKKLGVAVNRNVALVSAGRIADRIRHEVAHLSDLYEQARANLDLVNLALHQDGPEASDARAKLSRLVGYKGNLSNFLVQMQSECRKQLEFYFNMRKEAFQINKVQEFQEVILQEIKAADPEVQQRIVQRLVQLGALRSSLDLKDN